MSLQPYHPFTTQDGRAKLKGDRRRVDSSVPTQIESPEGLGREVVTPITLTWDRVSHSFIKPKIMPISFLIVPSSIFNLVFELA